MRSVTLHNPTRRNCYRSLIFGKRGDRYRNFTGWISVQISNKTSRQNEIKTYDCKPTRQSFLCIGNRLSPESLVSTFDLDIWVLKLDPTCGVVISSRLIFLFIRSSPLPLVYIVFVYNKITEERNRVSKSKCYGGYWRKIEKKFLSLVKL